MLQLLRAARCVFASRRCLDPSGGTDLRAATLSENVHVLARHRIEVGEADVPRCPLLVRSRGQSGPYADISLLRFMTPNVWSGRALQEDFSSWRRAVLHQCIRLLFGALAPGHHDISARAISLSDRPRPGQLGHQCSQTPGRPNLHLVSSSRRPRQVAANSSCRLSG